MPLSNYAVPVFFLLLLLSCSQPKQATQFQVSAPSIEQEATSIWRTINDIEFLEQRGYNIRLPEHEVVEKLIAKSRNKQFGNADFPTIYAALEAGIYDKSQYATARQKVIDQQALLNTMITQLKRKTATWDWPFKTYPQYQVVFTLYGTGGSYDPDTGLVTLFTNADGDFMRYDQPANTIMHEIVHIGIQASLVEKYQLPHIVKERVVDNITSLLFKDQLTGYQVQNMGETGVDQYMQREQQLKTLPAAIKAYQPGG